VLVAGLGLVGAAAASTGSTVDQVVLRAAQVGPGFTRHTLLGGSQVRNQVTLDLCGQTFKSESLRTARLQVVYTKPGGTTALSNEVVTYRGRGAQEALAEVQHVASHCPTAPQTGPAPGEGPARYKTTILRGPGLLPDVVAVVLHINGLIGGRQVVANAVIVYQVRKNVLSAVYTYGPKLPAQIKLGIHAAGEAAANLRRI